MWLGDHEVLNLLGDSGPPLYPSWVTARSMASLMASWSIGHCPENPYPRVELESGRQRRRMALGGTRTPLLSDAALWRLLGRTGRVDPHFCRSLDLEYPCLFGRTTALAEAVVSIRELLRGVALSPSLQAPQARTNLGGLALMGKRMLPHLLEVVLAECLPGRAEDRRRTWTMAAANLFRNTSSTVANAIAAHGTYTVGHLERFQGSTREQALTFIVGPDEAASGRFDLARECPLPDMASVPLPLRRHEIPGIPLEERHDLLGDTVRGLSEAVTKTISAVAQGRDEVARLRAELGPRLAAVEARAPGTDQLATMEDFAQYQQHSWRLSDQMSRQCDQLLAHVETLVEEGVLPPGRGLFAPPAPGGVLGDAAPTHPPPP